MAFEELFRLLGETAGSQSISVSATGGKGVLGRGGGGGTPKDTNSSVVQTQKRRAREKLLRETGEEYARDMLARDREAAEEAGTPMTREEANALREQYEADFAEMGTQEEGEKDKEFKAEKALQEKLIDIYGMDVESIQRRKEDKRKDPGGDRESGISKSEFNAILDYIVEEQEKGEFSEDMNAALVQFFENKNEQSDAVAQGAADLVNKGNEGGGGVEDDTPLPPNLDNAIDNKIKDYLDKNPCKCECTCGPGGS